MNLWFFSLMMVSSIWAQQPTDVDPEESEAGRLMAPLGDIEMRLVLLS